MSRGPSRKEERKNSRLAKKQRKSLYYQKGINARKGLVSEVPTKQHQKSSDAVKRLPTKNRDTSIKKKWLKVTPATANSIVDEEDDEEILSDSDAYADSSESEPEIQSKSAKSKSKKAKKTKRQQEPDCDIADNDDFLTMMDEAFASGKLTKNGFIDESSGKIESGSFSLEDDEDEESDNYEDLNFDDEESDSELEAEDKEDKNYKADEKLADSIELKPTNFSVLKKLPSPSLQQSPESIKLLKQIQSLINKLSSSNLVSICNDFEGLFRNNRRKEVIELLTDTIISSIVKPGGNLLDSFALNFAALSFIINHMVGIEFGAHLIEKLIENIDQLYIQSKIKEEGSHRNSDDPNIHERSLVNCMNFCSFLYDLQMISSNLICDLIRQSAQRLEEIDVEIILKLFKTCGQQIKRDDADFMKFISGELSKNASAIPKDQQSSRFKFMIETINDLKDSKRKLASAMTVELEPVKKMLKNFLSLKLISKVEPLRISLEDVRNIESKGKWWLVGSSWHPQNSSGGSELERHQSLPDASVKKNEELAKIERLAKTQRMNTEIRKAIFSTIVSSDDYCDAFERLIGMKLTGKQEREIILVLIHCCGQEKAFNPFYALLAGKFASYRQGFRITLQYTFWDCLKQVRDYPIRKLANISKLYGTLLAQQELPLSILRKGNFIRLKEEERIFWQLLFMTLFTRISNDDELDTITQIFVESISTGMADNPTASSSSSKGKVVVSMTENFDMAEFDDEFFAAQDKIETARGMSLEKLEEFKALRDGLIYFLEVYFVKTNDFPFTSGVDVCKKRAKKMKQILSMN